MPQLARSRHIYYFVILWKCTLATGDQQNGRLTSAAANSNANSNNVALVRRYLCSHNTANMYFQRQIKTEMARTGSFYCRGLSSKLLVDFSIITRWVASIPYKSNTATACSTPWSFTVLTSTVVNFWHTNESLWARQSGHWTTDGAERVRAPTYANPNTA
jgi:hypothetical protein